MPPLNYQPLRRPQPQPQPVISEAAAASSGPMSESEASSVCTNISDSYSEITKNMLKQYNKEKKQVNRKIENVMLSAEGNKGRKLVEATAERARNEYETKLWEVKGLVIEILERQTERIKKEGKKHNVPFAVQFEQLKRLTAQMNRASEIIDEGPSKSQLTQLKNRLKRLNEAYEGGDYYQQETFETLHMTVAEPAMRQRETFGQKFMKFSEGVAGGFAQLWALISTAEDCMSRTTYSVGSDEVFNSQSTIDSSAFAPAFTGPAVASSTVSSPMALSNASSPASSSSSSDSSSPASSSSSSDSSSPASSSSSSASSRSQPASPITGKRTRSRTSSPSSSPKNKTARISSAVRKLQSAFRSRQSRKNAATRLQASWKGYKTRNGTQRSRKTPNP